MNVSIASAALRPNGDFVYPYVYPSDEDGIRPRGFWEFSGVSKKAKWPLDAPIVAADPPNRELGDFPYFSHTGALTISARAHELLSGVLETCGEILPVKMSDGTP